MLPNNLLELKKFFSSQSEVYVPPVLAKNFIQINEKLACWRDPVDIQHSKTTFKTVRELKFLLLTRFTSSNNSSAIGYSSSIQFLDSLEENSLIENMFFARNDLINQLLWMFLNKDDNLMALIFIETRSQ